MRKLVIKRNGRQIYVGDYVRLTGDYLKNWTTENPQRIEDIKNSLFLVVDSTRCYSWREGILGGGMLLTLKPCHGPLAKEDILFGRGEDSVEVVEPHEADKIMSISDLEDMDAP